MAIEIELNDKNIVLMSDEYDHELYSLIFVDAKKFQSICPDLLRRSAEKHYLDKYRHAGEGFANSHEYPVPLPDVGHYFDYVPGEWTVRFTDGTTRVQWLLDHGVKTIPILCSPSSAAAIKEVAGAKDM